MNKKGELFVIAGLVGLLLFLNACDAIDTDVLPVIDSTYDIGSEALSWSNAHFDGDVDIGGELTVGGTATSDDLITSTATFNDQVVLAEDGKVWIEFRPELDFDIVKKNAVPLSHERGVFTGFELPIWDDDNEELFFNICVPDRWDGISATHIHLDVFLIEAQDDGDSFRLQIVWEHYTPNVDIVPDTFTLVPMEVETGASAAFQSYHVHFDVPAGDMLGDDILAFRLRRIATTGTEIDGLVVIQHTGVIFLCNRLGNAIAE